MIENQSIHLHEHSHSGEFAFPADEETLLLSLAKRASEGTLSLDQEVNLEHFDELERHFTPVMESVEARLGDAYPTLRSSQKVAVLLEFAQQYENLPTTHPRYAHHGHDGHGHDHDHGHDCGRIHGPIRRSIDAVEQKMLGKIGNKRAQALAAAAFRGMSLVFCPGDDLAAIGLQVYAAASGHGGGDHHDHHQEHVATLPRRPRISFETQTSDGLKYVTAELPLDVPLRHEDLPGTPAFSNVEHHIEDVAPIQEAELTLRHAEKEKRKAEKAARPKFRKLALGALALSLFGFLGNSELRTEPTRATPQETTAPAGPADTRPDTPRRQTEEPPEVTIRKGDSQWKIAERWVEKVTGDTDVFVVNETTKRMSHLNKALFPDPDVIEPGGVLQLPSRQFVEGVDER